MKNNKEQQYMSTNTSDLKRLAKLAGIEYVSPRKRLMRKLKANCLNWLGDVYLITYWWRIKIVSVFSKKKSTKMFHRWQATCFNRKVY